jgi:hypothetical protein
MGVVLLNKPEFHIRKKDTGHNQDARDYCRFACDLSADTNPTAAGGGVKGGCSVCRGQQPTLVFTPRRMLGTANGYSPLNRDLTAIIAKPTKGRYPKG